MKNPIDLAAQAAAFADKYNMLPQGSTVLCALSGGADSMALLSVLEALAKPRSLTLHAAHFNHQLRGEESQRDEDFVVQWCQKRGIPLVVGRGDVAQEAQEQGKGVEETARAMRYGFLTATAQELGADKIATAHNADDNAETLLLHLARGTGLDGLTGIPPVRGILIRPLLATPRIDIAVYLAQEEIPHVEDSSNQDTVYARNRLRQEVMPVLRDLNPAFVSTLAANLVHLREDRDLLHAMAEKATKTAVVSEGRVSLSARTLAALPHPVAVRAVKQLLAKVDRFQISSVHLEQILSLAAGPSPSATLNLPDDLFVWREYDDLHPIPGEFLLPGKPQALQNRQHAGQQIPPHRLRGLSAQRKLLPLESGHAPQDKGEAQAQGLPAAHRPITEDGILSRVRRAPIPPPKHPLLLFGKAQPHRREHIPSGAWGRSSASKKAAAPRFSSSFSCSSSFSSTAARSVSFTSTAPLLFRLNSVRHPKSNVSISWVCSWVK